MVHLLQTEAKKCRLEARARLATLVGVAGQFLQYYFYFGGCGWPKFLQRYFLQAPSPFYFIDSPLNAILLSVCSVAMCGVMCSYELPINIAQARPTMFLHSAW